MAVLPERLLEVAGEGVPALVLTVGDDGYAHTATSWMVARAPESVRFGADIGSTTLRNLERQRRASIQVIGPNNIVYLLKGRVVPVKARIESALFPVAMMEMQVGEAKDQAWPGVVEVSPLSYRWVGDRREEMASMEQAVLAELREWERG